MAVYFWIPAAGESDIAIFTMIKLAKVLERKVDLPVG